MIFLILVTHRNSYYIDLAQSQQQKRNFGSLAFRRTYQPGSLWHGLIRSHWRSGVKWQGAEALEIGHIFINTVNRNRILNQIIGANTEKIALPQEYRW
jgi:hypothetical protein